MDLTVGIGFPGLINAGVRAQLNQAQIGFTIGSFPFSKYSLLNLSGDVYYHFGSPSRFSKRDITYVKASINYFKDENESEKDFKGLLGISAGRDYYFSHVVGINLDFGLFFKLIENKSDKVLYKSYNSREISEWPLLIPYAAVALFYRM
jgi:hypothetical protein